MNDSQLMIEISGLTKKYGPFTAVDQISLEVRRGEIFSFLGVNGAGKTTTLSMLVGVLQPTAGRIRIGGYDLDDEPERAKAITGYIPDRPYLYPKMTGREYLYFVSELYDVEEKTAEQRIDELLDVYALVEWQDELIESFSHGMKQRLATCGALINRPELLVVDEPMVGLDPHGAKLLKDSFRSYAREGMTIFLSTHSLNVAEELSHRVAIIHRGCILSVGTVEELHQLAGGTHSGLEEVFLHLTINV